MLVPRPRLSSQGISQTVQEEALGFGARRRVGDRLSRFVAAVRLCGAKDMGVVQAVNSIVGLEVESRSQPVMIR